MIFDLVCIGWVFVAWNWVGTGTTSVVTEEEDGESDGVGKCEIGNVDVGGVKLMALIVLNVNVDEMDEEWGWVGNGGMELIVKSFWWKGIVNSSKMTCLEMYPLNLIINALVSFVI